MTKKKIFCFDIDGVICKTKKKDYLKSKPNRRVIEIINQLYKKNNLYYCDFSEPQLAVTPGQSIVFYDNDTIIGGGIIEE